MQTKSDTPPKATWHENSGSATFIASPNSARIVARLTARSAILRERHADLAALLTEQSRMAPAMSVTFVDGQLVETARLAAELLELAERANEHSGGGSGTPSMRRLADVCFDAILSIDAARHDLHKLTEFEATGRAGQRRAALRRAQQAVTMLNRQLTRSLAN